MAKDAAVIIMLIVIVAAIPEAIGNAADFIREKFGRKREDED